MEDPNGASEKVVFELEIRQATPSSIDYSWRPSCPIQFQHALSDQVDLVLHRKWRSFPPYLYRLSTETGTVSPIATGWKESSQLGALHAVHSTTRNILVSRHDRTEEGGWERYWELLTSNGKSLGTYNMEGLSVPFVTFLSWRSKQRVWARQGNTVVELSLDAPPRALPLSLESSDSIYPLEDGSFLLCSKLKFLCFSGISPL